MVVDRSPKFETRRLWDAVDCGALAAAAVAGAGAGWAFGPGIEGVLLTCLAVPAGAWAWRRARPAATPATAAAGSGWDELQRELDRSRRHRRPFVLVRIPLSGPGSADSAPTDRVGLPDALRAQLRSVDSLWCEGGSAYVLLPESNRAMAERFVERARAAHPESVPAVVPLVGFPEDGVTKGALVELLHGFVPERHSVLLPPAVEPGFQTA